MPEKRSLAEWHEHWKQQEQESLDAEVARAPSHLQGIVRVLLENERHLSDGYEFYSGDEGGLREIARKIYEAMNPPKDS